ncbi:MAG: hypothetical protein JW718_02655 [Desulfovibrionaceae bacterium]|nr:hypothetical protein [Desulfovibrionaceae bacterium]
MVAVQGRKQTVLAWIPARGGSKGLPGKALQDLGGRPVIAHTIAAALESRGVDRVIVNTDSPAIRAAAVEYGAEAPFLRPAGLAADDSPLERALEFQRAWLRDNQGFVADIAVGMSPTYPFRLPGRIDQALDMLAADPNAANVRGMCVLPYPAQGFWGEAGGALALFCAGLVRRPGSAGSAGSAGREGGGNRLYQNLFSFNAVKDNRDDLHRHPRFRLPIVLELTLIESIDLDEPKDLDLARLALEIGLFRPR